MKKQKTILLPNITGNGNMGDLVITVSMIKIIRKIINNSDIRLHLSESKIKDIYSVKKNKMNFSIFSLIVLKKKNVFMIPINIIKIVLFTLLVKINNNTIDKRFSKDIFYRTIKDFRDASLIIFVGGGYLRTKKGLSQSLNLILQLLQIQYAKLFKKTIIVGPISFGPFAHIWQEKIASYVLRNVDKLILREKVSLNVIKKHIKRKIHISSDLGFMLQNISGDKKTTKKRIKIGFTIRNWLSSKKQQSFEKTITDVFTTLAQKHDIEIQPIIQATSKDFPKEDDTFPVNKISNSLLSNKVAVLKPITITNLKSSIQVYRNIDILVGMRMHSNIIAATQGTPFVAIAYEHKTQGILKSLGLSSYCIDCKDVDTEKLIHIVQNLLKNRSKLRKKLLKSINIIQANSLSDWRIFLQTI